MAAKRRTYRKAHSEKVQVDWHAFIDQMMDPNVPAHFSGTYTGWKAGAHGHGYSPMNQFWIQLQDRKAEGPFGPFSTWKAHNRFPRKGTAKSVLKPVYIYKTEKDAKGKESKVKIGPVGYTPINTAFAYSDTDGEPLKLEKLPEDWELDRALKALEIKRVKYDMADGNTQGYSYEKNFALNPVAAHPMKTTFHELAHIVLGHTAKDHQSEYVQHRGVKEFQAEAVAYILAHELELTDWNASESRAYVRHWLSQTGEDSVPEKAIRQVFGAVSRILNAGREAEAEENGVENGAAA